MTSEQEKKGKYLEAEDAADMHRQDLEEKESCTVLGPYHFDLRDGYRLEAVGRPTLEGHNHLDLEVEMLQGYRPGVGTALLGEPDKRILGLG